MAWDGMLPEGTLCQRCGAKLGGLSADGNHDRPAELYAGTYTGLCNRCMHAPVYVEGREWDNALHLSYPPLCPSHRRDRIGIIAYADCQACQGRGRTEQHRQGAWGGDYYELCYVCLHRYSEEAHRKDWLARRAALRQPSDYNALYEQAMCKLHKVRTLKKVPLFPWTEVQTAVMEQTKCDLLAAYQAERETLEAAIAAERAALMATVAPTEAPHAD